MPNEVSVVSEDGMIELSQRSILLPSAIFDIVIYGSQYLNFS